MRAVRFTLTRQRGAAAVELALVAIPLVMLVVASVEFARAFILYDQLTKAVREGARFLSFFDPTVAAEYPTATARNRMVYGTASPAPGASPVVPGLTTAMIQICDRTNASACPNESFADVATGSGSRINLVTVRISGYVFQPIFPGLTRVGVVQFEPISATLRQF